MMLLQIYFEVPEANHKAFEQLYTENYVPALQIQEGYLRSNLLRVFPPNIAQEIDAAPTPFNYQMELIFDTEANRRRWVASEEHQQVWPMAAALAISVAHCGYNLISLDRG